jgi:undecaprenyl-diphosphatase
VGAGLLLLGAGATALVAARATRPAVQRVDDRWYALVQRTRTPSRWRLSHVLDRGFSTIPDWSARVAVTAVLVRRRRWRALGGWVLTIVLGEVCIGPVKAAIGRFRPPDPLVRTSDTSYPSGHAIAAATTAPGMVLALVPPGRGRDVALSAAVAIAAATAVSRTDLNAHWLSDSVGGFSLGAGFALAVPAAVDALSAHRAGR